jgi:hypothetical protein
MNSQQTQTTTLHGSLTINANHLGTRHELVVNYPDNLPSQAGKKVRWPQNATDNDAGYLFDASHGQTSLYRRVDSGNEHQARSTIVMNPDPLAPCPINWSTVSQQDKTTGLGIGSALGPELYGYRLAEQPGMAQFITQTAALARESAMYRVVGCGLKVTIARTVDLENGVIRGGHFTPSQTTYTGPEAVNILDHRADGNARSAIATGPLAISPVRTQWWLTNDIQRNAVGSSTGADADVGPYNTISNFVEGEWFDTAASSCVSGRYIPNSQLPYLITTNYGKVVVDPTKYPIVAGATGVYGTCFLDSSDSAMRASYARAKKIESQAFPASDGMSIRWYDSNEFAFQRTRPRSLIGLSAQSYNSGLNAMSVAGDKIPPFDLEADGETGVLAESSVVPLLFQDTAGHIKARETGMSSTIGRANYVTDYPEYAMVSNASSMYGFTPVAADVNFTSDGVEYYPVAQRPAQPNTLSDGDFAGWSDDIRNFGDGLWCELDGLEDEQQINVQFIYHIEYVPVIGSLGTPQDSPVDADWPNIYALAHNADVFPYFTRGHSFFKSLWHGLKAAGHGIIKLLGGASKIAAIIPDPRAQAFSKFAGTASGIGGQAMNIADTL